MKKIYAKRLAFCLLAAAAAVLLIAGCGRKKDVSGKYRASYNLKETLNKGMEDTGLVLENDVNADFVLCLNTDKSFSLDLDGKGLSDQIKQVFAVDGPAMIRSALSAEGVTEDQYEVIASEAGFETFEEFEENMIQDLVSDAGREFVESIEADTHFEGTYSVDGSTLTLTGSTSSEKGMDQGTIGEDGSISVSHRLEDDTMLELKFVKE